MNELFLIYILRVGADYEENITYQFIFSDTTEDIDGEDWDTYPAAAGRPSAPNKDLVRGIGTLVSEYNFDVTQESDTFAMWDAIDGIIALGWENVDEYDEYPEHRMFFRFGETGKSVADKLYNKDLVLEYKQVGHGIKTED